MTIRFRKSEILGYVGSAVLFLGVFLPFVEGPFGVSINFLGKGNFDALVVIAVAILAVFCAMLNQNLALAACGIGAFGLIGFDAYTVLSRIAASESSQLVSISFGIPIMMFGSIMLFVAGFMGCRWRKSGGGAVMPEETDIENNRDSQNNREN